MNKRIKKIKDVEEIIRNSLTAAFFRYHSNKMSLGEFLIRFIRLDLVSKGNTPEKLELLKAIRNYQRGIKENCICPPVEPVIKKNKRFKHQTFAEFLRPKKVKT